MTADQIAAEIAKADYAYYGIRITDEPLTVGQFAPDSRVWDDGEPTNDTINGACAVTIDDNGNARTGSGYYFGDHISLIAGNMAERGRDKNEIIIRNAYVIATWSR